MQVENLRYQAGGPEGAIIFSSPRPRPCYFGASKSKNAWRAGSARFEYDDMKIKHLSITVALGGLLALAIGCKKAEAPPSAAEADKAVKEENTAVSQGKAAGTADGAATQQGSADAQQVIDKANALLQQSKADEALRLVQSVPFSSLSATQRAAMNNLQFQIRQSQANRGAPPK